MLFSELTEIRDDEPHGGALNMAIDETLFHGARTPLLRIYRWAHPAISFGYFGDLRAALRRWPGREPVRRWTGGGEVPHGGDLTYTLVVPRSHPFARVAAAESYRAIHEALAPLLRGAVIAELGGAGQSLACFENAARFDLLIGGRKVAGAAQRRTANGLLHQGSIQTTAGLDSLRTRLAQALGAQVSSRALLAGELHAAEALAAAKYSTDAWLRRFERSGAAREETIPCASEAAC